MWNKIFTFYILSNGLFAQATEIVIGKVEDESCNHVKSEFYLSCLPISECVSLKPFLTLIHNETDRDLVLDQYYCQDKTFPYVCCPGDPKPLIETPPPNDAEQIVWNKLGMDEEVCCPIISVPYIYGGKPAEHREFPWIAVLQYQSANDKKTVNCAGSLINNRYILTAAHCVSGQINSQYGKLISVRLGEYELNEASDCHLCDGKENFDVEEIIPHEDYNKINNGHHNDIALIRLNRDVTFTNSISPICLPFVVGYNETLIEPKYTVAGWGRTLAKKTHNVLMKVDLPNFNREECIKKFKTLNTDILESQICAGGIFKEDSCDGDSGGPLMVRHNSCSILAGVVSFGYKCGLESWPAIYTNILNYKEWILKNIKQ